MEPPARIDSESVRDEKVKVLKAIVPLARAKLFAGNLFGYRPEKGVAVDSKVETFVALKPAQWIRALAGVSSTIRAGKGCPSPFTAFVAASTARHPCTFGAAAA